MCSITFSTEKLLQKICLPNLELVTSSTKNFILQAMQSDATYGLKPKLFTHWLQLYNKAGGRDFESSKRRRFFSICTSGTLGITFIWILLYCISLVFFMALLLIIVCDYVGNSYLDILHSNKKPFYNGGPEEDSSAMDAYLMHSVGAYF